MSGRSVVVGDLPPLTTNADHQAVVDWLRKLHVQNRAREKSAVGNVRTKNVTLGDLEVLGILTIEAGNKIKLIASEAEIGDFVIGEHSISSANYVAGVSGFIIDDDGTAEFNDVTVRGEVDADTGTIGGFSITAHQIASTNYNPGVAGLALNDDGTAEFGAASIRGTLTTGQLGANVATNMDGADAAATSFGTSGDETIVSLSFTTTGEKLRVDFITGFDFSYTPGGAVSPSPTTVTLKRGTTTLFTTTFTPTIDHGVSDTAHDIEQVAYTIIDTPAAGTYTYTVHIDYPYPGTNNAHQSLLIVTEFKR